MMSSRLGKAPLSGVVTESVSPSPSTMSVSQLQVDEDREGSVSGSTVAPVPRTTSDLEKGVRHSKSPGSDNELDDRDEPYNVHEKTDDDPPTTVVTPMVDEHEFPEGGLRAWSVVLGVEFISNSPHLSSSSAESLTFTSYLFSRSF